MVNRKSLIVYLVISFCVAWLLFILPLAIAVPGSSRYQVSALICWAVAMWAPGLAALIVTKFSDKKPLIALNLNHLGDKKTYLWAWLIPIALAISAGFLTWALGVGILDLEFTQIREAMAESSELPFPTWLIIALQVLIAFTIGPLFNTVFGLGEELGWRGYLLPSLLPIGQWRAMILSGLIWGIWHIPVILQGHNYPGYPIPGVFMMIIFCVLFGIILSWLYLRTISPWAPALAHGSLNAVAGLPLLFMPGVNMILGGTLTSLIGWIPMVAFISWLILTKRLPVLGKESNFPSARWR